MSNAAHRAAAFVLFILFAAYGLEALTIPLFPGQEQEPFKPRTLPVALAAVGMLLMLIRILRLYRSAGTEAGPGIAGFRWAPAALLCVAMLAYGFLMVPLGFVLATTLFLTVGFAILGERRRGVLLFLPVVFSLAFFLLMTEGLGLYLAPGAWFGL
ncbi:MAG: tripartite tricarboxylate transporter TctB family protein [Gammaproteobacteria bacterium]|nr:tripartite tricarboxylate transporter TctB family protein [Gammaproteobacteria bacterium]MDH5346239.1 tripartite tricarboxylate transporter TctB family protein [Gammaproteobacteria bacterium]